MASKEITLWIDEHWYDALRKHFTEKTLEEHLNNAVDELCKQLPEDEYERISNILLQEQKEQQIEMEASRRFVVFRVTEHERKTYFVVEENMDVVQVASRLRAYTRKSPEQEPTTFCDVFSKVEQLSHKQFYSYISERKENTGRVVGAYNINLDAEFLELFHIEDGWLAFRVSDVNTAVYHAMKKSYAPKSERLQTFLVHLHGKQLTEKELYSLWSSVGGKVYD